MPTKEAEHFLLKVKDAKLRGAEKELEGIYNGFESGLRYIGSTAIEDKLQLGVPETIDILL